MTAPRTTAPSGIEDVARPGDFAHFFNQNAVQSTLECLMPILGRRDRKTLKLRAPSWYSVSPEPVEAVAELLHGLMAVEAGFPTHSCNHRGPSSTGIANYLRGSRGRW